MSVHDEAFSALDVGLRNKLTPEYHISRGEDDALQWQPPARSRELANALSYHYPLENTIEEKMQRAILDFLESELPDRIRSQNNSKETLKYQENSDLPKITGAMGKTTPNVQYSGESPPQSLQIVQGSEMFGTWDVKTGQSVKPKGRKRGLSPTTRQRVAENRGNTCAYHQKAKTQCHPSQCRQNKLYPGTVANSILTGTNQVAQNDKGKVAYGNVGMSNEVSTTVTYDDGHVEKRFKGLPSPSLSPSESTTLLADNQTLYLDLDHNCHESGPNLGRNNIHICLNPHTDQDQATTDKLLLERSETLSQESGDIVQDLQWASEGDIAYLPFDTNDTSQRSSQSAVDQSPSGWHTDVHEDSPPIREMGGTNYFDWTEDLIGSDLPSLEHDWPREDSDQPLGFMDFLIESDKFVDSDVPFALNSLNRFGTMDELAYPVVINSLTEATETLVALPEPALITISGKCIKSSISMQKAGRSSKGGMSSSLAQKQDLDYNPRREKVGGLFSEEDDGLLSVRPPDEFKDTIQQVQVLESATIREKERREKEKKLKDLRYYRSERVELAGPKYGNRVLSRPGEITQISIDGLATLLQNSHLNLIGKFEQLYPGKDESSLIDIVLLDDADQNASVEVNPESILNAVGTSFDKMRLLRSSCHIGAGSFGEILSDQSHSSNLPNDSENGIAASDSLKNQAETSSSQDLHLRYISLLLDDVSNISNADGGRLVTLIYRSTAAATVAKRAIVTLHDSVEQSSISTTSTLRWLDPKWRTIKSIIADMDINKRPGPYCYTISDSLCITPTIPAAPPPDSLSLDGYPGQMVEPVLGFDSAESVVSSEGIPTSQAVPHLHEADGSEEINEVVESMILDEAVTRARRSRRSFPIAVIIIKKPVNAMKALWTKLARVKL